MICTTEGCNNERAKSKTRCNPCRCSDPRQQAANKRTNEVRRARYKADPEWAQAIKDRNRKLFYGLTPERFQEMVDDQGGRCAICGVSEPGGHGNWHVDHDHRCCPGKKTCGQCIRGLLCALCNVTLGTARDNPAILRAMADYIEDYDV